MTAEPEIIIENSDKELRFNLSEEEKRYLEGAYFNPNKNKNIEVFYRSPSGKPVIRVGPYAGIIDIDGVKRLHFSTKVRASLFYMLSYLRSEDDFHYDPERVIQIKEGLNFFDVIARFYQNYLEEIIRKGFLKKYVEKREPLRYLRGKLIVSEQLRSVADKTRFNCEYFDLTYNNLENRIVLAALHALIPMVRYNFNLRRKLRRVEVQLKDHITLVSVNPRECSSIKYNRINNRYREIISLAKVILEERYIRSVLKGSSKGFNFIVNMNRVYEDFVSQLVEDVANEYYNGEGYKVEKQSRFTNLVRERRIITKPDVILRKGINNFPLIIDAKYKKAPNNADYYQLIAYSLALKSNTCCLIYPKTEAVIEESLTLLRDPVNNPNEITKLYIRTIDLEAVSEDASFDEYVSGAKIQVKQILDEILNSDQSKL